MLLYPAGIENHPDGSGNLNAIVNGNWGNLNALFNPATGMTGSQTGTTFTATADVFTSDDVGATIRMADDTVDTIAGYSSPTVVTMTTSQTIGSQAFEVYRTSESQRDGLFRGLYKRPRVGAAQANRFVYYDDTNDRFNPSVMYETSGDVIVGTGDLIVLAGNLGIRNSSPTAPLHIKYDSQATGTDNALHVEITTTHAVSTASGAYYNSISETILDHTSGVSLTSAGGVNALLGQVILNDTGTTTNVNCVRATYQNNALGTVTNVALFRADTSKTAAASITNLYAFFVPTQSWTGTITNRYGVYVQDAASKNVFAGDTGIGTSPSYRVHVTETTQAAGTDYTGRLVQTLTQSSSSGGPQLTAFSAECVLGYGTGVNLSHVTGQVGLAGVVRPNIANGTTYATTSVRALFQMDYVHTITELSLFRAEFESSASGVVTSFAQFHAPAVTFGGTTVTNKYAIWQEDTALVNRLEGPLQANVPSGEIYADDVSLNPGIVASTTWKELTSGLGSRNLYKMSLVSAHALDVDYAGDYLVIWNVSFTGTSLNDYEGGVIIDSSTATVYAHAKRTASTASAHGSFGASAKLTLTASQEISLAFQNVGAANDLTISHVHLTLVRLAH
jgi:hypothetical protein